MSVKSRIPKATLDSWRTELSNWNRVDAFRHRVDEMVRPLSRSIFFGQAGLAFLRDAWIAGRVATALSSDLVRLTPTERPDFEIQIDGLIQQFEATEADRSGRRRGDERENLELEPDPIEKWRERFEAIPAALDRVVTKKIAKHYPPGVGLVIYINLGCYGTYLDEGLPVLQNGTAPAKDKFSVVLVMWEGIVYKLWEDGQPVLRKWPCTHMEEDL
ncbi:hypothetical protein IVB44_38555 [Bradyrhizobium sp. 49]|uniref:hypothetical protein n=1 Tax=unclassified Bradyrhizobium TaxID=2631580 RepID=UPI001FFB4D17|nr:MULTISPECIES: hypothetical protein [unclassified Bradyrhizobium]MCK1269427.1 hypothetical protein [Bradyrhizobium sp. 84]MCK1376762.1 hypothetical protein [Bradyrhizobium sp. 49]